MGARLSQPKGPGGESSVSSRPAPPPSPAQPWGRRRLNSRTLVAPAAAATMAILLFVYARTSIRAAKANAQRHREADSGGEGLSLVNENRRRHGTAQKLEERGMLKELADTARQDLFGQSKSAAREVRTAKSGRSEEDERLRNLTGKGG
ncbi:hypothetical protein AMS68_002541 [Peltaster fructicola]|uniref:Uncharacterized protein n=1 Tax=Peltaster fructicola TaxID=286661 RepID=A0A6H0XQL7_9PEZI|nr:hypothetical protein AMS68_002541 [Peltaster fructicola]